jgi:hypothetical protein
MERRCHQDREPRRRPGSKRTICRPSAIQNTATGVFTCCVIKRIIAQYIVTEGIHVESFAVGRVGQE